MCMRAQFNCRASEESVSVPIIYHFDIPISLGADRDKLTICWSKMPISDRKTRTSQLIDCRLVLLKATTALRVMM